MAMFFGSASGALWLLSSVFWAWSALARSPIKRHPYSKATSAGTLEWWDDAPDGGGMAINGLSLPSADTYEAYAKKLAWLNTIAAGLSGVAALAACAAVWTTLT